MENASKALIIAGAILLSILIIGLGMMVYNSSTSVTGSINLDSQEIGAHNSQFLAYDGRQKGSQIITLLNLIQSNNKEYDDRQITVSFTKSSTPIDKKSEAKNDQTAKFFSEGSLTELKNIREEVKSSTTYNVKFEYADNGLIQYSEISVYKSN